jgi:hypothetical protein
MDTNGSAWNVRFFSVMGLLPRKALLSSWVQCGIERLQANAQGELDMAQSAKADVEDAADKTASNISDLSKRAGSKASETTREVADQVERGVDEGNRVAQRTAEASIEVSREIGRRSAEGVGEVGQAFNELAREQNRHGFETFRALAGTVDWNQAAQIHSNFVRSSFERWLELSRRYIEVVQSLGRTALSTAQAQADKASAERGR